nr:hypothetical protein BdHM001_36430 [Bdellovibrio sp. HM001]
MKPIKLFEDVSKIALGRISIDAVMKVVAMAGEYYGENEAISAKITSGSHVLVRELVVSMEPKTDPMGFGLGSVHLREDLLLPNDPDAILDAVLVNLGLDHVSDLPGVDEAVRHMVTYHLTGMEDTGVIKYFDAIEGEGLVESELLGRPIPVYAVNVIGFSKGRPPVLVEGKRINFKLEPVNIPGASFLTAKSIAGEAVEFIGQESAEGAA